MPKELPPDLTDRILAEISRVPGGVTIARIEAALGDTPSRRTVQRRLADLLRNGRIVADGSGPATHYRRNASLETTSTIAAAVPDTAPELPLSQDAEMVRTWVRMPITQRAPVGYDPAFLESYRPNETWYLSDPARRQWMHDMGASALGPQRPVATYARNVLARLLIDLSWASSQLEGNTYTRLDTQRLIENGEIADGKARIETQMILNHKQAIEFLVENANEVGFDMQTFLNLHALLSEDLMRDPLTSGRLRTGIVDITGTVFRPLSVAQQIEVWFRMILDKAAAISDPFEQALFLMVHIPYLQPFEDVNKRVSRLAANIPLIKANLCPLSFVEVPAQLYVDGLLGVYERNRVELLRDVFVWAYERSCQQFRAISAQTHMPDPFRLKYRNELIEVVCEIVRQKLPPEPNSVKMLAAELVPDVDMSRFKRLVMDEFPSLHEGSVARYRLRLSEFRAWKSAYLA